jgi:glycosyltransferase involved in cell wall biosynthesis
MRIAIVTGIFPPDVGGPATHASDLAIELRKAGHAVTVVTLWNGPRVRAEPGLVAFPRRWAWPVRHGAVATWIAMNGTRSDVVYATGLQGAAVAGSRAVGLPCVVKVVGDPVWERGRRRRLTDAGFESFQSSPPRGAGLAAMRMLRDRWLRAATAVTAPSMYLADLIDGWLGGPAGVEVIPNGVRVPAGSAVGPREDAVVFVGRLVAHKRVDLLIGASARSGIRLDVIGDGPERSRLEEIARDADAPVSFAGDLAHADALDRIRRCAALALASDYEGLPHVVLEALVCGTPVISPRVGGVGEVVEDGVSGILVDEPSPAAFADAFSKLRDEPGLRERLSEGAANAGKAWRSDRMAERIIQTLERSRRGRPRLVFLGKTRIPNPPTEGYRRRLASIVSQAEPFVIGVGGAGVGRPGRATAVRFPDLRPGALGGAVYYPVAPFVAVGAALAARSRHRRSAIVCQSPLEGAGAIAVGRALPRSIRPRVVVEVHGDWRTATRLYGSRYRRFLSPLVDRASSWAVRRADLVRTVSGFTRSLALEAGYRGPIDTYTAFGELEGFIGPKIEPLPDRPVALFVGVLEPYKSVDVLIEAWRLVRASVPGSELIIAGEGSHRGALERQVRLAGLDASVTFLGHVGSHRVRELLDGCRLLALPSRSEGMGRVILEAFARGRPVVATRTGGIPELVRDQVTGLLVPPEDPESLSKTLVRLLEEDEARAMGEAARAAALERERSLSFEAGIERLARWA